MHTACILHPRLRNTLTVHIHILSSSPSACRARSRARTWRVREEEALARAKADSLLEGGAADDAEAEELRRALQLSSV